jgi:hypothetical protein
MTDKRQSTGGFITQSSGGTLMQRYITIDDSLSIVGNFLSDKGADPKILRAWDNLQRFINSHHGGLKTSLRPIINAGHGKDAKKQPLLFENYLRQIERAIATDREKKIAKLELCRVIGAGAEI